MGWLIATGLVAASCAVGQELPRDSLWAVVRTCITAQRSLHMPLPCLQVDLDTKDKPGTAILRSPWSKTHTLVVPTVPVTGIEAPSLQSPSSGLYWAAAKAARRFVVEAADRRVALEAVGLAINSKNSRSQDQLHIHVDCAKPDVLAVLTNHASEFTPDWRLSRFWLAGTRWFVTRVGAAEFGRSNLFERLMKMPGYRRDLSNVAVAAFAGPSQDAHDFYVLAIWGNSAQAERLLDHSCAIAQHGTSKAM